VKETVMLRGFEASLDSRLREAEAAEKEVLRLQHAAEEAPKLRIQKAKEQRRFEREQNREAAMKAVNHAVQSAAEKQAQVPSLIATAGAAVQALYVSLKEIARLRQEAADSLAIADRIDYEMEVEEGEEREVSMDRDPRGLAYAIAARHGDGRVKVLLEGMDPGFDYLRDCDLSSPLCRSIARLTVEQAVAASKTEPTIHPQKAE
jgi:hypothetical protein